VAGRTLRFGTAPVVQVLVVVVAYVALAAWGEAVSGAAAVTLWYPPPGLAVAAVVLGGARFIAPTIVAELIVSVVIFDVADEFGLGLTLLNAVLVGGSYALVGLGLRSISLDLTIPDLSNLGLLAGGLVLGAIPGAVLGTTVLRVAEVIDADGHLDAARTWFQGDAIGMLSLTPAIILGISMQRRDGVLAPRPPLRSRLGALEIASVVTVPVVAALLVEQVDMLYLSLAPIVLVAVRRAHPGSAIAAAIIAGLVPTTLAIDGGAFDRGDVVVLLAVVALTGLVMGLVVAERFRSVRTNERLGRALANTEDLVVIAGIDGIPQWWNQAAERFVLRDAGQVLPAPVRDALRDGRERAVDLSDRVARGTIWEGEEVLVDRDGHEVAVSLVVIPELAGDGAVEAYTLFARDVSAQRSYEAELTRQALYDDLTGVANRALLQARLHQAATRVRDGGAPGAVMLLDLDRFKVVNDSMGHATGDELLRAIAQRLAQRLRRSDTLARIGGDEFAIVAEDLDGITGTVGLAQAVLNALREPFHIGTGSIVVTASIGIVRLDSGVDETDEGADELLRRAELAMYRAKARGGTGFAVYDEAMSEVASRRLRLESCLRATLLEPSVPLHYQPVVDLDTGTMVFAEALLRIEVEDLGAIPPPEIVAVALETGLIDVFGRLIARTAATAAATWPDHLGVAINVSPAQLQDERLPELLEQQTEAAGLSLDRLILELTEDAFLHDPAQAAAVLHACRALGVRVALDDFGSGFSSLSILRTLPIDILKLDNALLSGLAESPQARAVVQAVTSVADALGLEVVAEGIETPEQLEISRSLGCRLGQGYLLCRPTPADQLGHWVAQPS